MTKEEHLKAAYEGYFTSPKWDNSVQKYNVRWADAALESYAKQEVIAFDEWKSKRNRVIMDEVGLWPRFIEGKTTEKLYEEYLKSKTP
jgi:hypothetical protein